jgi:predicted ester cyclase
MSEINRTLAIRWFEEVWNRRLEATIDELMAPHCVGHMEGIEIKGPNEFKQVRSALITAFPDLNITVEGTVAEGDNVIVRWCAAGSHRGEGFGLAATEAPVVFRGMTWLVMAGGRIVEGWDAWNQGALVEMLRASNDKRLRNA